MRGERFAPFLRASPFWRLRATHAAEQAILAQRAAGGAAASPGAPSLFASISFRLPYIARAHQPARAPLPPRLRSVT